VEVLGHLHAHALVFGQQVEQTEAGEVEVVVLAAAHEEGIDAALTSHGGYFIDRIVSTITAAFG